MPIRVVIQNPDRSLVAETMQEAYVEDGVMANSDKFDGLTNIVSKEKIADYVELNKLGKRTVN